MSKRVWLTFFSKNIEISKKFQATTSISFTRKNDFSSLLFQFSKKERVENIKMEKYIYRPIEAKERKDLFFIMLQKSEKQKKRLRI